MTKLKIKGDEELIKIPVLKGDVIFVKYPKGHRPVIKTFSGVIPC
jgi:hypothetical protein